jgi:hypothetical protein
MTERTPAQVSQDQYERAVASALLASLEAGQLAVISPEGVSSPQAGMILTQFRNWAASSEAMECPHSPQRGELMFWYPGGRGLMCMDCFGTESQRMRGTDEDYRCDLCGRVWKPGEVMHQDTYILNTAPGEHGPIAPLMLMYAWCLLEPCKEAGDD